MLESRGHTSPRTPCLAYVTAYTFSACAMCKCSVCTQKVPRREYLNTFYNVTLLFGCVVTSHTSANRLVLEIANFKSRPVTPPRPLVYDAIQVSFSVILPQPPITRPRPLVEALFYFCLLVLVEERLRRGFTKNCIPE